MDKRGQTLGLGVLTAIVFFVVAMSTINFVMSDVSQTRNNLNCSDAANISDGTKILCLVLDTTVIYWIIIIFSVIMGIITARLNL